MIAAEINRLVLDCTWARWQTLGSIGGTADRRGTEDRRIRTHAHRCAASCPPRVSLIACLATGPPQKVRSTQNGSRLKTRGFLNANRFWRGSVGKRRKPFRDRKSPPRQSLRFGWSHQTPLKQRRNPALFAGLPEFATGNWRSKGRCLQTLSADCRAPARKPEYRTPRPTFSPSVPAGTVFGIRWPASLSTALPPLDRPGTVSAVQDA